MKWLWNLIRGWGVSVTVDLPSGYVNTEVRMSLSRIQCRHTLNIARLILRADELGWAIKVCGWNRTLAEQKENVATGKSNTMNSPHLELRATDLVLFTREGVAICEGEAFRPLGEYWESLGKECRWGGRFHDPVAFKVKTGRDFDPEKDLGWDSDHFETSKEAA